MALKKSEKRLLGILGVVAVVFVINQFVCSSKDKTTQPKKAEKAVSPTEVAKAVSSNLASSTVLPKKSSSGSQRRYFETWGRDPFSVWKGGTGSVSGSKKKRKKPVLNGIFWKEGKAYVLINDDIMGEGEEKGGIRVEKIEDGRVLCSSGGRSFTLLWSD